MTTISLSGGPARPAHKRSQKSGLVRPRFKSTAPAPAADSLPPDVQPAFTPAWWGYEPPHDPAGSAERDRHALAALLRLRQAAADAIEDLLQFLDETGGAEDLEDEGLDEPAGDELDAGYPEGGDRLLGHPNEDDEDGFDTEDENEHGGDYSDLEPCLGWTEAGCMGGNDDCELTSPEA